MGIAKKLQESRVALQKIQLTKSGQNKFAGYDYFELADFLPTVSEICEQKGICPVVTFTADIAKMQLIDVEDGSTLEITSPMGSANLKGCHQVQNIGAVETYQRRYLYMVAFEIVEHDALDALTDDKKPVKPEPKQDSTYQKYLDAMATVKKELSAFETGEAGYYKALEIHGAKHANEIKDVNLGRQIYKDLSAFLSTLKPKPLTS